MPAGNRHHVGMHHCWQGLHSELILMVIRESAPQYMYLNFIESADGKRIGLQYDPSSWEYLNGLRRVCRDAKKDVDRLIQDDITLRIRYNGIKYDRDVAAGFLSFDCYSPVSCLPRRFRCLEMQQTYIVHNHLPQGEYTWQAMIRARFHLIPATPDEPPSVHVTFEVNAGSDAASNEVSLQSTMNVAEIRFLEAAEDYDADGLVFQMPSWIPQLHDLSGVFLNSCPHGSSAFMIEKHMDTLQVLRGLHHEDDESPWVDVWISVEKAGSVAKVLESVRRAEDKVAIKRAIREGILEGVQDACEDNLNGPDNAAVMRLPLSWLGLDKGE